MEKIVKIYFLIIVFVIGVLANELFIYGNEDIYKELLSSNVHKRVESSEVIIRKRQELIKNLMIILREKSQDKMTRFFSPYPNDTLYLVIKILGKYRAVEAIPLLIKNIDYHPINKEVGSLNQMFPSVGALIEIGHPAAKGCLRAIVEGHPQIELLSKVIVGCYGKGIAEIIVERKIKICRDNKRIERLKKALKIIKETKVVENQVLY